MQEINTNIKLCDKNIQNIWVFQCRITRNESTNRSRASVYLKVFLSRLLSSRQFLMSWIETNISCENFLLCYTKHSNVWTTCACCNKSQLQVWWKNRGINISQNTRTFLNTVSAETGSVDCAPRAKMIWCWASASEAVLVASCTEDHLHNRLESKAHVQGLSWCVTVGDRSFATAGPQLWNSLPADVRSASSLTTFRQKLKTHLFRQSYPDIVL